MNIVKDECHVFRVYISQYTEIKRQYQQTISWVLATKRNAVENNQQKKERRQKGGTNEYFRTKQEQEQETKKTKQ